MTCTFYDFVFSFPVRVLLRPNGLRRHRTHSAARSGRTSWLSLAPQQNQERRTRPTTANGLHSGPAPLVQLDEESDHDASP